MGYNGDMIGAVATFIPDHLFLIYWYIVAMLQRMGYKGRTGEAAALSSRGGWIFDRDAQLERVKPSTPTKP